MLAGPALSHAQPARTWTVAPAAQAQLPFKATLRATTHTPRATRPWRYVLRVTNLQGRPIRASARFRIVFNAETPPPPRDLGRHTFRGRYEGIYRWPPLLRGEPLAFQAIVRAKGATRTLRYGIRVR